MQYCVLYLGTSGYAYRTDAETTDLDYSKDFSVEVSHVESEKFKFVSRAFEEKYKIFKKATSSELIGNLDIEKVLKVSTELLVLKEVFASIDYGKIPDAIKYEVDPKLFEEVEKTIEKTKKRSSKKKIKPKDIRPRVK